MLSPSQQYADQQVRKLISSNPVIGLICKNGNGLSTLLQKLSKDHNGHLIRLADFFDQIETLHPLQLEEGITRTILEALKQHDVVLVDDFTSIESMIRSCYGAARPNVLLPALDAIVRIVEEKNKHLILGLHHGHVAEPLDKSCTLVHVPELTPKDFKFLFHILSGRELPEVDFEKVHRFAPKLSASSMHKACRHIEAEDYADTDAFLSFLERRALVSNVNTREVDQVDFNALFGVKEVIRQLEVNIINPLERDDLVKELGLKPKRGVLLYGPPGTGKTTIGRALAHRLRSKFFLIDGTVISGTNQFYQVIQQTFQHARENAPCVLFIDDCDLLFENEQEPGLYRYLLTMLDGLESKSNEQITIMLTAMNIGSLPPALIRSGRVELWLEMKLPDAEARASILQNYLKDYPLQLTEAELQHIAGETDGLTGADLKRIVTDAKNLYGFAVAQEEDMQAFSQYVLEAIQLLREHRQRLEEAPAFTAAHQPKQRLLRLGRVDV
jgi:SpoVK/Ycf46/Vps4 family AAA+-type ATPase